LRRMVLVPTMKAAALYARVVLAAMSLAALLVLALTLASPAAAQEGDDQAATRATDSLQDAVVTIQSDDAGTVNRIEIADDDCRVEKGATVTVGDENGTPVTFVDGVARNDDDIDANLRATADQIVVDGFVAADVEGFQTEGEEDSRVTDSSGITCDSGGGQRAAADEARDDDNLENLDCDELLVLFRGEGEGQYGVADRLADSDVRARIEVCLKKEIVNNPGGNLPNTGGLSLIGLAVLGVVSAVAGLAVIRGGRR
jgi:hypothetical protein